jgi:hypothetical protein
MKKVFLSLLFLTLSFSVVTSSVYAASATTPTPAPSNKAGLDAKLNAQINELKEKIASRVSELNLVERRGIIGVVSEVSGNKVTVKDVSGKTRFIDVDEITKFSSASNKTFGLSDLTKGTRISVLGLYNKQSKRILARFINMSVDPTIVNGVITALDSKNFFITVTTADQKQIKLDIQTTSKIYSYDKADGLVRGGFSKLEIGHRVMAIGFPDKTDAATIVPTRVTEFTDIPKDPKISAPAPEESESPTPATQNKTTNQ